MYTKNFEHPTFKKCKLTYEGCQIVIPILIRCPCSCYVKDAPLTAGSTGPCHAKPVCQQNPLESEKFQTTNFK